MEEKKNSHVILSQASERWADPAESHGSSAGKDYTGGGSSGEEKHIASR